jgi:putative Holliday junction resolvase
MGSPYPIERGSAIGDRVVVLGLDVGSATIGVAVANGGFVFPVTTIRRRGVKKDIEEVRRIASARGAVRMVIGLAVDDAGVEQRPARLARQIGEALAPIPVEYVDERLTTREARARLERLSRDRLRDVVDQEAAVVILEEWLRSLG